MNNSKKETKIKNLATRKMLLKVRKEVKRRPHESARIRRKTSVIDAVSTMIGACTRQGLLETDKSKEKTITDVVDIHIRSFVSGMNEADAMAFMKLCEDKCDMIARLHDRGPYAFMNAIALDNILDLVDSLDLRVAELATKLHKYEGSP